MKWVPLYCYCRTSISSVHADPGQNPQAHAEAVRNIMADCAGLSLVDRTYDDKLKLESLNLSYKQLGDFKRAQLEDRKLKRLSPGVWGREGHRYPVE